MTTWRDNYLFRARVAQMFIVSIFLGLVYFQVDIDQKGTYDVNGALYIIITSSTLANMFTVLNSFPVQLAVFMREYGTGLYRLDTYYIATSVSEAPYFTCLTCCFLTITYWMMGLYMSFKAYLVAMGCLLMVANITVSLGYVIAALAGDVGVALALMPPLLVPFILFGGLFINTDNVPDYMVWLEYMSWFKWSWEAMMINQWQDIDEIECDKPNPRLCQFHTGEDALETYSLETDHYFWDFMAMLFIWVGFRIISFVVFFIKAKRSKG